MLVKKYYLKNRSLKKVKLECVEHEKWNFCIIRNEKSRPKSCTFFE